MHAAKGPLPRFAVPSPEGRDSLYDLPFYCEGRSQNESLPFGEGTAKPGERSLSFKRLPSKIK